MGRVSLDEGVYLRRPLRGGAKQVVGIAPRLRLHTLALLPKAALHLLGGLLAHVALKEHLQQIFAGFAARAHDSEASSQ